MGTALRTPTDVVEELTPSVADLLNTHLAQVTDWDPAMYVPLGEGRDLWEYPWQPTDSSLSPALQAALLVNVATEDDLPGYRTELDRKFGEDGAWGTWLRRWTAEEGRHSIALRAFLWATRGVDPEQLETARMHTIQAGYRAQPKSALDTLVYVTLQELATRVSHFNTGMVAQPQDAMAMTLLKRIAADENHHFLFYRNLVKHALEIDPSATVQSICREVRGFTMPGENSVPGFRRAAAAIAKAGIYSQEIHFKKVLRPTLRDWNLFGLQGLNPQAERAREELAAFLMDLKRSARVQTERIKARQAATREAGGR
jgi:acyl-[acyl-carrier-protein] desaturase